MIEVNQHHDLLMGYSNYSDNNWYFPQMSQNMKKVDYSLNDWMTAARRATVNGRTHKSSE